MISNEEELFYGKLTEIQGVCTNVWDIFKQNDDKQY